jgi:hypothetical protein
MKRREFLVLVGSAMAAACPLRAQQKGDAGDRLSRARLAAGISRFP